MSSRVNQWRGGATRRSHGKGRALSAKLESSNRSSHTGWVVLNDRAFNARAWLHATRRPSFVLTRIWHWHGYKPDDVRCWLEAIRVGRWPLRAWRSLDGCNGQGRCSYRPVKNSGCHWFGRIDLAPCYLRTYTHLLVQHRRLLWLSDSI